MNRDLVFDTNVLLSDGSAVRKFGNDRINIPFVVLQELDKHKTDPGDVGVNARTIIKFLDELRESGDLAEGVQILGGTTIRVIMGESEWTALHPDDQIISTARALQETSELPVGIVSNDINLRVKASLYGVPAEGHNGSKVHIDESRLFTGISHVDVDSHNIDELHMMDQIQLPEASSRFPNTFLHLRSPDNPRHTGVARVVGNGVIERLRAPKEVFGIRSKNLEQTCAFDLLLNEDIPLVTLMGQAGTGKTLVSLAAALECVLHKRTHQKVIIMRPPIPMGRDIGYLPGPQPLSSKIVTPEGWTTMGEVKPGSFVIGRDGQPTKVLGVYPKGKKETYLITTSDGTQTQCCEDHLWLTKTFEDKKRGCEGTVKSTKEIISTLFTKSGKPNHYLPRNEPVHFSKKELPIAPYTLGALLGNGSFSSVGGNGRVCITSTDNEILGRIAQEVASLGCKLSNYGNSAVYNIVSKEKKYNNNPARSVRLTNLTTGEVRKYSSVGRAAIATQKDKSTLASRCEKNLVVDNVLHEFLSDASEWTNPIRNKIAKLGILGGLSYEKAIPSQYKYSTIEDRTALLQGLMDTDGTIKKNGEASFITTSKKLAEDLIEVVRSLGGRATLCSRDRVGEDSKIQNRTIETKRVSYEFTVSLPKEINPFYVSRKAERHKCTFVCEPRIVSVEKCGFEEVQCIMVDNEEHLYLTNDFIVTHNTLYDKMSVWMGPIIDNFELLLDSNSKSNFEHLVERGVIEIQPPTFIRGRSIMNSIVFVDEAQGLTQHEMKTIVTRMHESSKLIVTGDIRQIDNPRLSALDNGFSFLVEAFKPYDLAGHVTLTKCERSTLASLAAEIM